MTGYNNKEERSGFIRFIFGGSADYVRELMPLFAVSLAVMVLSSVIGFYQQGFPDIALEEVLGDLLSSVKGQDRVTTYVVFFLFIFINNALQSLLVILLGVFFGLYPVYFLEMNGYILGGVFNMGAGEIGLIGTLMELLPHGIFEFPAILLCAAAGLRVGYALVNRIRGRTGLRQEIVKALRLYAFRIVLILIVAALIESALIVSTLAMGGFFG